MSNGLFVLRDDLVSTKSELINAKSSIEGLKKELSEERARELEAKTRESKALGDLQIVREDSCAWREKAEELQALDAKFSEVMARLLPTEERLKETALKLEHTEGRADEAEAAARDAAEKLVLAEKETKEALDKMAAAEARAQKAVQEYKSSPDFAVEFSEAVMDAFVQGFDRCKRRLSLHFQLGGLEHFQPDEEDPGIEVGRATGDPAAIDAPASDPTVTGGPVAKPVEGG